MMHHYGLSHRNHSPVNLAFEDVHQTDRQPRIAKVLPPLPQDRRQQPQGENKFDGLKDFRTKVLEMDSEIQEFKRLEREKHFQVQSDPYNGGNNFVHKNNIQEERRPEYRDEAISTVDLIEEQNNRIQNLQKQMEMLKQQLSQSKDSAATYSDEEHKIRINDENMRPTENGQSNLIKECDEEIRRRVGDWSPKDPYRGPMDNLYFPFGSAGGGAPNRDRDGNIQTMVYGPNRFYRAPEELQQKTRASQVMQENMKQDMLQQRLRRLQDRQQIREPEGDLSEILSNMKVGRPKRDPVTGIMLDNHLTSSDVTNMYYSSSRSGSPSHTNHGPDQPLRSSLTGNHVSVTAASSYGQELAKAARERDIMRRLERLRDQQEMRQHNDAWEHVWGGCHGGLNQPQAQSQTNLAGNRGSHTRQISPGRSNHRNRYEILDP